MNSSGKAEADEAPPRRIWWYIGGLLVVVVGSLLIGIQVLTVLLGALFPPFPPLPIPARLILADTSDSGDERWQYHSEQTPCEVLAAYTSLGQCRVSHLCAGAPTRTLVASCEGEQPFAQFRMRWAVRIAVDGERADDTALTVTRRILWTPTQP